MAVSRRPAPVKEVDLEQTAELPVIDFTGVHAEIGGADATISVAALSLDDSLSRTDTYSLPTLDGAAALADNLRDVEERLHRKSERLSSLERDLGALQVSSRAEIAALQSELAAALAQAKQAADEASREQKHLTAKLEEASGRINTLESRLGQHVTTLSTQEKELAQRGRRVEELQQELALSSSLARELGESRDKLGSQVSALERELADRGDVLQARVADLATVRAQHAQTEAQRARLIVERDELRGTAERQLEALHRLEGYRGVAEALLAERESDLDARESEIAELKTQLLQLAERDERIASLEKQLATTRERLNQQETRVSSLSTDGRALQGQLAELTDALASADRSAAVQTEALRVAGEHAAEIAAQLAAEREARAKLAKEADESRARHATELQQLHAATSKELASLRASTAAEIDSLRTNAVVELEKVRAEAAAALTSARTAAETERASTLTLAQAEREELQSKAAAELAEAVRARDALDSLLAERDAELRLLVAEQQRKAVDLAAREQAIVEREQAVTELLDDQQEQMSRLNLELQAAQETAGRGESDLRAAEEQLRQLEAEQRHREARIEELARNGESLQARLDETQAKLTEREDALRRLETEAHASNAVLGKLQQSIQRMSRDDTGARPKMAEPPLESMARLLIRVDGGTEQVYPVGRRTTLGRTPDNDIRLDANFVSRHHAVILAASKQTIVEDLNSTNGVVINGRRITRHPLQHGDVVSIGTAEFRFELRPMGNVGEPA
jgi:chromosome segregation ATPase